jgi:hypothetical protein
MMMKRKQRRATTSLYLIESRDAERKLAEARKRKKALATKPAKIRWHNTSTKLDFVGISPLQETHHGDVDKERSSTQPRIQIFADPLQLGCSTSPLAVQCLAADTNPFEDLFNRSRWKLRIVRTHIASLLHAAFGALVNQEVQIILSHSECSSNPC